MRATQWAEMLKIDAICVYFGLFAVNDFLNQVEQQNLVVHARNSLFLYLS
jgi:hypothetical protein